MRLSRGGLIVLLTLIASAPSKATTSIDLGSTGSSIRQGSICTAEHDIRNCRIIEARKSMKKKPKKP